MTGSDTPPIGAPCWIDLSSTDVDRSRSFYSQLFGWKAEEPSEEFGGYFMFTNGGAPVAGGMPAMPDQPAPNAWHVFLADADAAKTAEVVPAAGGQVPMPILPVADLGVTGFFVDSAGAAIGCWQPGTFSGFTGMGQPGVPAWFELHTNDYDAALAFYRDVFKWDLQPMGDSPGFRLATLTIDGQPRAGVYDASAGGEPSKWYIYFGVADTDATVAQALELGGTLTEAAKDTPYGRMASIDDPAGAAFKLVSV